MLQIESEEVALELIDNLTEQVWAEIEEKLVMNHKTLIGELLEEEISRWMGADKYERTDEREGYRGCHYQRDPIASFGHTPDLSIPWYAHGPVPFTFFDHYEHRRWDIDAIIGRLFLLGVSTRKIEGMAKDVYGALVSVQTVSTTTAFLEEELRHYQEREFTDDVEFLFLDGISEKVREIGVEKKVMLCAFGIHADKSKEILSFRMADEEDTASWKGFLANLNARGLSGKNIKLIISDGNPALLKAIGDIYPFHKIQRCISHRMCNVAVKLRRHNQKPAMDEARLIFEASNKKEALKRFKAWRKKWIIREERAVKCLEKELYNCLHYYDFPEEMWKKIRTTNILERSFREVRRRTKPMGVFPNTDSTNRSFDEVADFVNEGGSHLKEISAGALT
ncbi:MAG: IS256 family transposase [Actinomycetota bacterium]|nr:IS256 family transposase [Actinomycetota bacterium]